ncbi:MAG: sugar phosphate isomerase/epimerase family protein [Phycisphaerae bacterium]|nr:sugar phosphate isomerase/epimerase family protein [Tepidisphaeraceae bacterium]
MFTRRDLIAATLGPVAAAALAPYLLAADAPVAGPQPVKKFQIGVCDWMTGKGGTPDVLDWCAKMGIDGAMVSFGDPAAKFDLRKPEVRAAYAEAEKRSGAKVASLGMGVLNQIPYKSDPRTEQWVADAIDTAAAMNLRVILVAFFGKGDLKKDKPGTDEVIARFKKVMPRAEKAGVYLGIESWLSADEHLHIIESVGSPNLTCYYDVGNSLKMGYDIYKEIRRLGTKHICEFHAKDLADKGFGNGDVDFWEVRRAFDDIGYRGWFHLEGASKAMGLERTYRHDRNFLKGVCPENA